MRSSVYLILLLCFFTITSLFSQRNIKNDSTQVKELYSKAIKVIDANPVESRKIFEKALIIINKNISGSNSDSTFFLVKKAFILERLAYFLRRENKYGAALEYLQKSLEIKRKVGETYTLGYTYSQTAWLWLYQSEFEKTKINLDSAYALSKKYNNIIETIRILSRYGILYQNTKENTKAEQHHLRAIKLADSINETKSIAATNANYAFFLRKQKKYKENIPYLEKSVEMHRKANNQIGLESGYFALGVTYRVLGMPYKAIELYNQALAMSEEQKNEAVLHSRYLGLSNSYADLKDYEKAYSYHLEYTKWWIKVKNEKNYQKMVDLEAKYKYEQQLTVDSLQFAQEKREIELVAETESSKKKLYFTLLLVTLIGGGVIGYLIRRNYQQRSKLTKATYENEKKILDQEIKDKEEDIKRLIADNTMRLNFKQELLDQLNKELSEKKSEDLKVSLLSLAKDLRSQINTESKLSSLQHKIEEVNQGFDSKLIKLYPQLTKTEREVCSLLRLNLSIKEIMTIRNASQDAVKSIRYRIRKKLGLSSGEELEKFIQNIT